jgi:hypothetical protein
MQLRLPMINRLLTVIGFLGWLAVTGIVAQTNPLVTPELLRYGNLTPAQVLAKEERFVGANSETAISHLENRLANHPPEFTITPDVRRLTVGSQITLQIRFRDPDNDAFLGAAIAANARLDFEATPLRPQQQDRLAPVKIDLLPSPDPTLLIWQITAQQPGTAIMFISISELFTITLPNGQIRLRSGEIRQTAYALQVVDLQMNSAELDPRLAPRLQDPLPDIKLQVAERTQITLTALSPASRPLHYGMLFLAFASRLLEGRFAGAIARTQAVEPGQGIFVAYATDGLQTDVRTFRYQVVEPQQVNVSNPDNLDPHNLDPPPQLRGLSANAIIDRNRTLLLYGERFTANTLVTLQTVALDGSLGSAWLLPAKLLTSQQLQITVPATIDGQALSGLMRVQIKSMANHAATDLAAAELVVVDRQQYLFDNEADNEYSINQFKVNAGNYPVSNDQAIEASTCECLTGEHQVSNSPVSRNFAAMECSTCECLTGEHQVSNNPVSRNFAAMECSTCECLTGEHQVSNNPVSSNFAAMKGSNCECLTGEHRISNSPVSSNFANSLAKPDCQSQLLRILPPVITDINIVRDDQQRPTRLQVQGLGIGRDHIITANGRQLKLLADRGFTTSLGDLVVVQLPRQLRKMAQLTLEIVNSRNQQRQEVVLPLIKMR